MPGARDSWCLYLGFWPGDRGVSGDMTAVRVGHLLFGIRLVRLGRKFRVSNW